MTRILLVFVVVAAVAAVLWSSWRLDRRLFAALATVAAVLLVLFVGGFFQSQERVFAPLPVSSATLELRRWRATESGIRLQGIVHNASASPLAQIEGVAILLDCPGPDSCRELHQVPLELRQHVPAGASYPFDLILRYDGALPEHPSWRLQVEQIMGYTEKSRVTD